MKRKILLICSFAVIVLVGVGFVASKGIKNNIDYLFNKKVNLIIKEYNKDYHTDLKDKIAIISISSGKDKAKVIVKRVNNIHVLLKECKEEIKKDYLNEKNSIKWLKLDIVDSITEITYDSLKRELEEIENDNTYRKGIMFNNQLILTEAELNSNGIIDYNDKNIDIDKLNNYLKYQKKYSIKKIPNNLKIFTTISFFCDEDNNVFEINNESNNTGRRKNEELEKKDIKEIIDSGSEYLRNMIENDGKFIYGYYPISGKKIDNYNILRHAGSIWSLIVCNEKITKEEVEKTLSYINKNIKEKDSETSFLIEKKSNEIKLGGNALAIIAMCEYTEKYKDIRYLEVAKKLGNGIIEMQKDEGQYIHILDVEDFSTKEEYRTVYYDGEATFALSKLYGITKDEKYLKMAEKAIKYFMVHDYTNYCDHWISYAVNEITNYIDDEDIYEFGLKNVSNNMNLISEKKYTSHINFEMLMQCLELYNKMIEKNLKYKCLNDFPYDRFERLIEERARFQLNSYMYPEIGMYFANGEKYVNTFFIRQNSFRIRIDDIQHSILGYNSYLKNYDKIHK